MKTTITEQSYQETIDFLHAAQRKYELKGRSMKFDEKIKYLKKANQILNAAAVLISLTFEIEDFIKTGKFEPSKLLTIRSH